MYKAPNMVVLMLGLISGAMSQETCSEGASCVDASMESPPSLQLLQKGIKMHSKTATDTDAKGMEADETGAHETKADCSSCSGKAGCVMVGMDECMTEGMEKDYCTGTWCPAQTKPAPKPANGSYDVDVSTPAPKACGPGYVLNPTKNECKKCPCYGPQCLWDSDSNAVKCPSCGKGDAYSLTPGIQLVPDKTGGKCVPEYITINAAGGAQKCQRMLDADQCKRASIINDKMWYSPGSYSDWPAGCVAKEDYGTVHYFFNTNSESTASCGERGSPNTPNYPYKLRMCVCGNPEVER